MTIPLPPPPLTMYPCKSNCMHTIAMFTCVSVEGCLRGSPQNTMECQFNAARLRMLLKLFVCLSKVNEEVYFDIGATGVRMLPCKIG